MIKWLERAVYTCTFLVVLVILFGLVNGAGCRYDLSIEKQDSHNTFLTCHRGKVMVLHTLLNQDREIISQWKVSARQLQIGKQLIYFVYHRERLEGGNQENETDRYNQIFSGYKTVFYHIDRIDDRVFIFANFPKSTITTGLVHGEISFFNH